MKLKEMKDALPRFRSHREEADFWAKNTPEDYLGDFDPVDDDVVLDPALVRAIRERSKKKLIALRLETQRIAQAKAIARAEHKPYQALLREWIARGLNGARRSGIVRGPQPGGGDWVNILRIAEETGYSYVLAKESRPILQRALAGTDLTIPFSTFIGHDMWQDFKAKFGEPFEAQVPAMFHIGPALKVRCRVLDTLTRKVLWAS